MFVFLGINIGNVNNIVIINNTSVRVDKVIKKEVSQFIKTDCKVTLGSDGIIGDKFIIIIQGSPDAPLLKEGQSLGSIEPIETNIIMERLDVTTKNIESVSKQLSQNSFDINQGHGTISRLIQDSIFAENLNQNALRLKNK